MRAREPSTIYIYFYDDKYTLIMISIGRKGIVELPAI